MDWAERHEAEIARALDEAEGEPPSDDGEEGEGGEAGAAGAANPVSTAAACFEGGRG